MKKKFSIVIALAPSRSAEVLKSIKKLDSPGNRFEIIVEKGLNPSINRNRGAKKAKGEIIAFIDDDAVLDKDILNNAEAFFSKNDIDIVGGPQLTPADDYGFGKISGYALSSFFGAWKISNRYAGRRLVLNADETMLTSANLFCRKKVFKKIKFNPDLFPGEDPDFINQAGKNNFKIAYSPDLIVYHRRRNSLKGMVKQVYSYGKTRPEKESFFKTLKMPFFIVPSLFLIYLAVLIILFLINRINFLILLPLIFYIILNISFSIADSAINKNFPAFFALPVIYLAIHLSYGAGFLISTIRKIF